MDKNIIIAKPYSTTLNIKSVALINDKTFVCKAGDSIKFVFTIKQDDVFKKLTNCHASFISVITLPDKSTRTIEQRFEDGGIYIDTDLSQIVVYPKTDFSAIECTSLSELIIYDIDETNISPAVSFRVVKSINGDIVDDIKNDIASLGILAKKLEEYNQKFDDYDKILQDLIKETEGLDINLIKDLIQQTHGITGKPSDLLTEDKEHLVAAINELKLRIDTVEDDRLDDIDVEITHIKHNINSINEDIENTNDNVTALEDEIDLVRDDMHEIKDNIKLIEVDLDDVESEIDDVKSSVENLKSFKTDIDKNTSSIDGVKTEITRIESAVDDITQTLMTPNSIDAFVIVQDGTHRFISDSQKSNWDKNIISTGSLEHLSTTDKTNIVNAVNELVSKVNQITAGSSGNINQALIGDLSTLMTRDKVTVVNAINELFKDIYTSNMVSNASFESAIGWTPTNAEYATGLGYESSNCFKMIGSKGQAFLKQTITTVITSGDVIVSSIKFKPVTNGQTFDGVAVKAYLEDTNGIIPNKSSFFNNTLITEIDDNGYYYATTLMEATQFYSGSLTATIEVDKMDCYVDDITMVLTVNELDKLFLKSLLTLEIQLKSLLKNLVTNVRAIEADISGLKTKVDALETNFNGISYDYGTF